MHISDIDGLADCHMDCDSQTTVGCTENLAQHDKGMYKFVQVCFPKICATYKKKALLYTKTQTHINLLFNYPCVYLCAGLMLDLLRLYEETNPFHKIDYSMDDVYMELEDEKVRFTW